MVPCPGDFTMRIHHTIREGERQGAVGALGVGEIAKGDAGKEAGTYRAQGALARMASCLGKHLRLWCSILEKAKPASSRRGRCLTSAARSLAPYEMSEAGAASS